VFGRLISPDARDANYPARLLLDMTRDEPLPPFKYWTAGNQLDQGQTGHCVGFGFEQFLGTSPVRDAISNDGAHALYADAKKIDGMPNEEGSTVRAGAQVLQQRGRIDKYLWAQSLDDIARYLLLHGPVVVGTNWYRGMLTPKGGRLDVSGDNVGGHCWILRGRDTRKGLFRMKNSWSRSWGEKGEAWIADRDLDRLMAEGGEACLAAELPLVKA
jgi:hypothetical protein